MANLTTLANVKEWLGVKDASSDSLLTRLISSASDYIQTWLNRQIATQTYSEVRDGPGGARLMFANYPVTAVSSVKVDGVLVPLSTSVSTPGYVFNTTSLSMRGFYSFTDGVQNVEISYTAGYDTIPTEIEQSCVELVGLRFRTRDRIGVSSKTLAGETIAFTQKDMSDAVESTLKNYKKVITV